MATLNLGTIQPGKDSLFNVAATTTQSGITFSYTYKDGRLPQGLSVQANGEIEGTVGNDYFVLDSGDTTLDTEDSVETTTIDREYVFTVTATGSDFELTTSNQQFKIKLSSPYRESHTNVFAEAGLDSVQRERFVSQYSNVNIFPVDQLYRSEDLNFGVAKQMRMLLISGLETSHLHEYMAKMHKNFANKTLYFGNLSTAKATNSKGTTIYEVLYYPVTDTIDGISASQDVKDGHNIPLSVNDIVDINMTHYTADQSEINTVYPNSLTNMRANLDDVNQVTGEFLPMWMRSVQDNGNALGWIPAVPIAYVKPGKSAQIKYNLEKKGEDMKRFAFQFNEIYTLDHLGTTYDNASATVTRTGDGVEREYALTSYTNLDSTTGTHTISTPKSVRVTVAGVTQDDRILTRKGTTDITTITAGSTGFYGSADGRIFDVVYHNGIESIDVTDVTADAIAVTTDGLNARSTTITFATPPTGSIVILRKQNLGFDTNRNLSFDETERTQTDGSGAGDGTTKAFTIFFVPKAKPTVTVGGLATTAFTYSDNVITLTTAPQGYNADTDKIKADGLDSLLGENNLTADSTGASISVEGVPDQTTFDAKGTTFGGSDITFDIGVNSSRVLPLPMRDLTHSQGSAVRRYSELVT